VRQIDKMTDDLPTARNTLPKDAWLCLFVWCKACFHRGPADLQARLAGMLVYMRNTAEAQLVADYVMDRPK
jgi:hypothetical protein